MQGTARDLKWTGWQTAAKIGAAHDLNTNGTLHRLSTLYVRREAVRRPVKLSRDGLKVGGADSWQWRRVDVRRVRA